MTWLLFVFIVAPPVVAIMCRKEHDGGVSVLLILLALGAVFATIINTINVNERYEAATRQGIVITTSLWQQRPIVVQPCRLGLEADGDGRNTKLVLPGTNRVVTPEMLIAICGKEG